MTYGRIILAATLAVATLLPGAGCLRRKETITVSPDQSVRSEIEYEAGSAEFGAPDAMPSKEAGWDAETIAKKNDEGKMEYTLVASKTFAPGAELPRNFATPGDPDADLYLDFPTELNVERDEDGTVYTLRRVYTSRPWAYVQYWEDRFIDDDIKKLSEKPADELTDAERQKMFRAMANVVAYQHLVQTEQAVEQSGLDVSAGVRLKARRALLDVFAEIDLDRYIELDRRLKALPEDSADREAVQAQIDEATDKTIERGVEAYQNTIRDAVGAANAGRYDAALARSTKRYVVTKETGGHHFEIRVKMPGRVIAHNADNVEEDGTVVWEFDGNAFRDRDHELLVVSRLQTPTADMNR